MLRSLWNWLTAQVPTDEQLEQDTPELREFYNRLEENRAIARQRVAELHERNRTTSPINVTRSPIHRKAS